MSIKTPIVDIPINDSDFRSFVDLFNEYKAQLAQLPAAWSKVGKAVEASAESAESLPRAVSETAATSEDIVASFAEMTAALMAQAEQHRRIATIERQTNEANRWAREQEVKAEKEKAKAAAKYQQNVDRTNRTIKETRQNVVGIAGGIASAAGDVLKWVGIGGIASGLIGGGGLFGMDRLANSAGDSRRSAQGLDTSVGDLKAFSVNYQRAVDPGSYLSNIETVARTPGLQYGVGGDIARLSSQGTGTADIGAALIPLIKQSFLQYGGTAAGMKASGLDNVVSLQEAIRISKLSDAEIAEIAGKYDKSKSSLAVNDQTAKDWQDLSVQLNNAGERIENVLIKDLDKMAPVIGHLSDEAVDLVDKFTKQLVPAVDHFATYLDSNDFQNDVKRFTGAVKELADDTVEALRVLGVLDRPAPDPATTSNRDILQWNLHNPDKPPIPLDSSRSQDDTRKPGQNPGNDDQPFRWWLPDSYSHHLPGTAPWEKSGNDHALGATGMPGRPEDWRSLHNPGDIFVPGSKTQMLGFSSDEEGLRAIDKQLLLYQSRGNDTLEGIAKKYVPQDPEHKNDTEGYIRGLVARTGFARDQHLDFRDSDTASKVISGITKQEHSNANYSPATVRVVIQNNTGGSAVVSTSQFPS